jgi:hypothetical protein
MPLLVLLRLWLHWPLHLCCSLLVLRRMLLLVLGVS